MKNSPQPIARDIVSIVTAFNAGRDPERLSMKFELLAESPFAFYRGTCHVFSQDFSEVGMYKSPAAWICGDLHLENFGSYKSENRLVYFDLDDFDEALLAPATRDLLRFLTSVLVAADSLKISSSEASALCKCFLDAYVAALANGKAFWVERATATGMVRDLLLGLRKRTRARFLDERTEIKSSKRKLRVNGDKALPVNDIQRQQVSDCIARFAETQSEPKFFKVLDVARRVAGLGSLGQERYVILVRGRGGLDGNFLIDLKHQAGSALAPYVSNSQPQWASEADRVVSIQNWARAVSPAFLTAVNMGNRSFVLKELQPSQDRLSLELWDGKLSRLAGVMQTMGSLVAWTHLRSGGRRGSACADEWINFGFDAAAWRTELFDRAQAYRKQVTADWKTYSTEYQDAKKRQVKRNK